MTTYDLFNGFVEAWPNTWEGAHRQGNDRVRVDAADSFKVLNLGTFSGTFGIQLSGARINAVLDAILWPETLRAIDQGASNVQAATVENLSALAHIQEVAASEGGIFFIAKDGTATFQDRLHATLLADEDTWGDAPTEKHYAQIATSYDDTFLWNRVTVTAPGLTDQTAEDEVSIGMFGGPTLAPRSLAANTLLTSTGEMLDRAELLLSKYKDPRFRVTSLELDNASLDDTQWPRILPKDIHDRVRVIKRPEGETLDQPSFIEGFVWQIGPSRWQITWSLSSGSATVGQWTLGTVGLSELGETTTLVGG